MSARPSQPDSTYLRVLHAAGSQCECTGGCGARTHVTGRRGILDRCTATTVTWQLLVMPRDLRVPVRDAWRLDVDKLMAWCEPCRAAAERSVQRAEHVTCDGTPLWDVLS